MDANLKAKWLADLRSGKFQQTTEGHLRDPRTHASYCCLGVLCISAGAEFQEWDDVDSEFEGRHFENVPILKNENIGHGDDPELCRDWMRAIGLAMQEQSVLISMNDEGVSFHVIADYIEKHL